MKLNCKIGHQYKKDKFDIRKFGRGFNILNPIFWAKTSNSLFRMLVVGAIVFGIIFSWGYITGTRNKPIKIDIGYGKEAIIEINDEGDHIYIDKKGYMFVRDKDKNILKQICVKDIPGLKKKLAPVGFQLQPIFIGGLGLGDKGAEGEVGVGISFLRYWKLQLETFLTQCGIYIGTSYKVTDNSGAGLAIGKGYRGDDRIMFYYRFNF